MGCSRGQVQPRSAGEEAAHALARTVSGQALSACNGGAEPQLQLEDLDHHDGGDRVLVPWDSVEYLFTLLFSGLW